MTPEHIVIIGGARSGTKLLRDALARAAGIGKVPYDIGYVWRYRNERKSDDVLLPSDISARSSAFIRHYIDGYRQQPGTPVIEKTVGNALRVPAVASVLPDAVFVHIIRDGVDVIESTRRQWLAPADPRYLMAKAWHIPLRLVPNYGARQARSIVGKWLRRETRSRSWGVRYPGMDEDVRSLGLITVCCRQWRESVVRARGGLERVAAPVVEVRYEQLVAQPAAELERVAGVAGIALGGDALEVAADAVTTGRVGVGRTALSGDDLQIVDTEVGDQLVDLGYVRPTLPDARSSRPDGHDR